MKIGSLVFATDQGLGFLARAFYDHGVVTDVLVIRHGRHPDHDEWYPGSARIGDLNRDKSIMRAFCASMDVMLFFETPFDWSLIDYCRSVGVKTALMPMYECEPAVLPAQPDLFINPSHLDHQYYPQGVFIPVPVEYPWRLRERAEVFVHNAGHGGLKGRNGTAELLEALWLCDCMKGNGNAQFIIRSQSELSNERGPRGDLGGRITWQIGKTLPYETLWSTGDVLIFPEKFNGLSLPLQEARAAGMLVMCGDRFPMNEWLPTKWCEECRGKGLEPCWTKPCVECRGETLSPLIPVSGSRRQKIGPPYNEFDEAIIDPRDIAAKIDEWYGRDLVQYSLSGKRWAEENSWGVLGPKYIEVLTNLCK